MTPEQRRLSEEIQKKKKRRLSEEIQKKKEKAERRRRRSSDGHGGAGHELGGAATLGMRRTAATKCPGPPLPIGGRRSSWRRRSGGGRAQEAARGIFSCGSRDCCTTASPPLPGGRSPSRCNLQAERCKGRRFFPSLISKLAI